MIIPLLTTTPAQEGLSIMNLNAVDWFWITVALILVVLGLITHAF